MNILNEIQQKLNLTKTLEKYQFVISFEGNLNSLLLPISNKEFYYLYNNGDPIKNILPHNITTLFDFYFRNKLKPNLEKDLYNGIWNQRWGENEILSCYKKYIPVIKKWFENEIREDKIMLEIGGMQESLSLNDFKKSITIKISTKTFIS